MCHATGADLFHLEPKSRHASLTPPWPVFTGGMDAIASPRVPAATAAALAPSGRAHPAHSWSHYFLLIFARQILDPAIACRVVRQWGLL